MSKQNKLKKKLYVIRWTTPVSRKRITYQTERVGTTKLRRVIVWNIDLGALRQLTFKLIFIKIDQMIRSLKRRIRRQHS